MAGPKGGYPATLWCSVAAALLGSLQFGYHMGVLNTSLWFVALDLHFDYVKAGAFVVAVLMVGASLGALSAGQIADAVGPGRALMYNNLFNVAGCILCAATPLGYSSLLAGRFLTGIAAGAASLYVPRYIAEISPVRIRGGLSTLNQVFICVGILLAYVVGLPYSGKQPYDLHIGQSAVAWWRVMFGLALIPAFVQLLALAVCPESPIWLEWVGKIDAANQARRRLLGADFSQELTHPDDAEQLISESERVSEAVAEDVGEASWSELFSPRYRRIMMLAAGLPLLQQASGINTVIFYSSQVFEDAGLHQPVIGSIIMGGVNVVGTLLAAFLIDHFGRRPLLLFSHAGMGLCLLTISINVFVPVPPAVEANIVLAAILAYTLFFALGVGPIPWVYLPEILPDRIKGRAAALCTCLNWVANLVVGLTFPMMLRVLGLGGSYLVFAVLNLFAVGFVGMYMVETKKRSLKHIQSLLLVHQD
ncbi:hypothetical protein WJX72_003513 [[Myrmecia] bisecta]|uniref:Major facilitator superfamily (MFS) profile domain-containing protein n=1 Tax=[Myrmecia] bisecta TaxID=41462 RepID=A0AAW1QEQ5_9CHLO